MTSDQFRAGNSGWPYLNTLFCNSRYGPFSYFQESGTHPGLYPVFPPARPLFSTSSLAGPELTQRYVENPAVIRPYCTSQPQFGLDVPSILPSVPNPFLDRGFTHLELMTKNFMSGHSGYMSSDNSASEGQTLGSVSAEPESSSSNFFYIKRENCGFESVRAGGLSGGSSGNQRAVESTAYGTSRSPVIQPREDRERAGFLSGDSWAKNYPTFSNNEGDNDKCNINVIDLSVSGSAKNKKNVSVKSETNNMLSDVKKDCKEQERVDSAVPTDIPSCSAQSHAASEVSIKNEPYHKYLPVPLPLPLPPPSPFISPPLSDIFQGSRTVEKCLYEREGSGSRQHDFLNTRLNPCYLTGNLPIASQFPNTSTWTTDKTYINPYRIGSTAGTNPPLLSSTTFDFSNPLGLMRDVPVPDATTSGVGAETKEQSYRYSRQTADEVPDNVDFRFPPVGFEILRDPVTGKFLLIPAASIEALQRALFWPGCQPPALLHISNNESVKNGIGATIKEEEGSVVVPTGQIARQEDPELRLQITRNWLLEKAVKEELRSKQPAADVSGLELLSRGIEKIERESDDGNLNGLGILCALAEQRIRDEVDEEPTNDSEKLHQKDHLEESGKPKKIKRRRRELNMSPDESERNEMSPPLLEKVTDIPISEEDECLKEELRTHPPTLTPNAVDQVEEALQNVEREAQVETDEYRASQNSTGEGVGDVEIKYGERVELQEENVADSKSMRLRSYAPRACKERNSFKSAMARVETDYLFRPISPDKPWLKNEETPTSQNDQIESFEIVHPVTETSASDCKRRKTRSETKAAAIMEGKENGTDTGRKHGKLILKLRREKRLSGAGDQKKDCTLTTEMLMTDQFPMKILTVEEGLFYSAQLSAIQPPDVYGITIDGERGKRPHIYSREEILNNSILELKPSSADVLKPGDRICAYWSGQYRSLYPGTVSVPYSPDPEPGSVNIEFDDGDSCRIDVNDIRLLPENYPITEYDPNPLLSLVKRKRKEKKIIEFTKIEPQPECLPKFEEDRKLKKKHKHKKHKHKHGKRERSEKTEQNEVLDGTSEGTNRKKRRRTKRAELPLERRPWGWSGKGFRRAGIKGKARKEYYRAIQRGDERIVIGECAVFLSTGRPDRPFIGRIESMWETWGANMVVRVKWFYHPEETVGCPAALEYPGGLFESPHSDENDVQTISHKCEVLPLKQYIEKLGKGTRNLEGSTTLFYLAGFYDPTNTSLQFQEGVK